MRDQNARLSIYRDLFFLILLVGLFYNIGLGSYPLFTPDEGRYSEVAREMVATGDYVTPRVNGIAFLDKPVLYYWLQAISIHLFGLSEWALRFFPMLAGLSMTVATYLFARQVFDRRTAILSAGILATSPLVFAMAHYANLDLEVACLITISLYLGMIALYQSPISSVALYSCAIVSGLAVLTKGLIGLFFPALILGVMFLYLKRWRALSLKQLLIAVALFLLVVLPWFIAVQLANPQFFHYFFVTQHITRFLSQAEFNNKTPVWFYVPIILIGFFPWSFFLFQAIKQAVLEAVRHEKKRVIAVFLLLFMSVVFIFFSVPQSKIISYILPIFPPIALLVGWYLSVNWTYFIEKKYVSRAFFILLLGTVCLLISLPFIVPFINTNSSKQIANTIKPLLTADAEVVTYFDYFYDLPLYLEKTVAVVADWQDPKLMQRDNWRRELALGIPFQNVSGMLMTEAAFWQQWHSTRPLFVVMSSSDFRVFKQKAQQYHFLQKTNDIVLVTNHLAR